MHNKDKGSTGCRGCEDEEYKGLRLVWTFGHSSFQDSGLLNQIDLTEVNYLSLNIDLAEIALEELNLPRISKSSEKLILLPNLL